MAARLLRVTLLAPVTGTYFNLVHACAHYWIVQNAIDARLDVVEGTSSILAFDVPRAYPFTPLRRARTDRGTLQRSQGRAQDVKQDGL